MKYTKDELYEKAPLVVHQRLCHEFVEIMKEHPKSVPEDIPEALEILTAVIVLEKIYPKIINY